MLNTRHQTWGAKRFNKCCTTMLDRLAGALEMKNKVDIFSLTQLQGLELVL